MDDVLIWVLVSIALSIFGAFKKDKKKNAEGGPMMPPFGGGSDAAPWVMEEDETNEVSPEPVVVRRKPRKPKETEVLLSEAEPVIANPYTMYSDRIAEWEKKYSEPEYNFFEDDENAIGKSAIGGENEGGKGPKLESTEDMLREFSLSRAIIYSEIIRPRYF